MKIYDYKVTYIIPAYNVEDTIEISLLSLIADLSPFLKKRIIVINDGSVDRTSEILKAFVRDYAFIDVVSRENCGIADSLNVAIKMSDRDSFVFRLDADDIVIPGKTFGQLSYMLENNLDICGTNIIRFGDSSSLDIYPVSDYTLKSFSDFVSVFAHPSVCFSPKSLPHVFYAGRVRQDFDLWKRLSSSSLIFGNHSQYALLYRTHKKQITKGSLHKDATPSVDVSHFYKLILVWFDLKISVRDKIWLTRRVLKIGQFLRKLSSL